MISIIIPIFNTEKYLPSCLDSVICQTYTDLEILLVDDGSTDGSGDICDGYAARDPRIRVLHQDNRGVSAARNAGVNAATGEYLYFMDSDDELALDCIELLARPLETEKYDFAIGQVRVSGARKEYPSLKMEDGAVLGNAGILYRYALQDFYMMPVNKLCRTDFIKANRLFFKEGIRFEDDVWSFQVALAAQSMYVVNGAVYLYVIRGSSFTENTIGKERLNKKIPALQAINQIIEKERNRCRYEIILFLSGLYQGLYIPALHNGWLDEYRLLRETDSRSYRDKLRLCLSSRKLFRTNGHLLLPTWIGFRLYAFILKNIL